MLRDLILLPLIFIYIIRPCPTNDELKRSNARFLTPDIVSTITKFAKDLPKTGYMPDYCKGYYEGFIQTQYYRTKYGSGSNQGMLVPHQPGHTMRTNIKICMNADRYDESVELAFLAKGKASLEAGKGSAYEPLIVGVIKARRLIIVVLRVNGKEYAVKTLIRHNTLQAYGTLAGNLSLELKRPQNFTLDPRSKVQEGRRDQIEAMKEIRREQGIIKLLRSKMTISDAFVDVCDNSQHMYPSDVVVMEYGGETLVDYYESLVAGETDILDQKSKNLFYERLAYILAALEDKGLSFCDLKPDNVVFDPANVEQTRLIDFGSVVTSDKKCVFASMSYGAPEIFSGRRYINAIERTRVWLLQAPVDERKLEFIHKMKRRTAEIIEDLNYKRGKTNSYFRPSKSIEKNLQTWFNRLQFIADLKNYPIGSVYPDSLHDNIYYIFNKLVVTGSITDADLLGYAEEWKSSERFDSFSLGVVLLQFEVFYLVHNAHIKMTRYSGAEKAKVEFVSKLARKYQTLHLDKPYHRHFYQKPHMTTRTLKKELTTFWESMNKHSSGSDDPLIKGIIDNLIEEKQYRKKVAWVLEAIREHVKHAGLII